MSEIQSKEIDHCYRVCRLLGEGLTGEVFLVEGPEGMAALKLLKPFTDRGLEENVLSAFKFEFGFLKDLSHPHVVRIQDFGFDEELGRFYFTEEYLEGCALDEFAKGVEPELIGRLFIQALEGLQAIHRAQILHGDLKPGNLWVVEDKTLGPQLKIIDLGLSDPRFPITAGTPSTMAPEKILRDSVDERSDLYSLGVVFYTLFTGENPFALKSLDQTYEAHLSLRPRKVTLKNAQVPAFWNDILENLLAKNPAYRFRNCGEVLQAIDLACADTPSNDRSVGAWCLERWVGREKLLEDFAGQLQTALKKKTPRVFFVTGEAGVGKSRLAQELKYRFQMEKQRVFESRSDPTRLLPAEREFASLWIIDDWNLFEAWQEKILKNALLGKSFGVLVIFLREKEVPALRDRFQASRLETAEMRIPPFSREDLEDFLLKVSGLSEIPPFFLDGLWEKTHGNPGLVVTLLTGLVKQKKLVDVHGRWNLAIFREGGLDFQTLVLDLSQIDRALNSAPATDPATRAALWLQRSEELLKKNLIDEATLSLHEAEEEIQKVEDLPLRLHLRARVYEKEGYLRIRSGRAQEARHFLERALALLTESGVRDAVLTIRLNNFVGWLFCQEGNLDAALRLFSEQQEAWEKLAAADQARVLNNDLGFAYLQKGDAPRAITALQDSLSFYRRVGEAGSQMKALYNLAEAHLLRKDYESAISHYLEAAEIARNERNYELLLRIYNGLGKTRHLQGEWREGLRYYERALEFARYLEDFSSAAAIAQNIGSIQLERGELDSAESNLGLALKMLKKLPESNPHEKYLRCRALLELGEVFRKRRVFEEAAGYLREAHALAFQEKGLESLRFWVLQTQCRFERDQGREDRVQDFLAELLPLANDEEKREALREFDPSVTSPPPVLERGNGHETQIENIPALPKSETELRALIRVARWLASEKNPEKLLDLILRQAAELSGAEAGILLLEDERGEIHPKASVNLRMDTPLAVMSETIAKQVLAKGDLVHTTDAQQDPRFNSYQSVLALHLRSILALPVRSQHRTLGVLALIHRYREGVFSQASLDLLSAFADQAGIALEQARWVADLEAAQGRLRSDLETAEDSLAAARRDLADSSVLLRFAGHQLVSRNPVMCELFKIVERIRDTELSVVLHGESGTGKELVARCLHRDSRRARGPFVAVNCAALPANLIESELFGYRAGAFTGASRDKKGLIEEAQGGTLFLDEIAELELPMQAKLLRVLQEREVTPLGDTRPRQVHFRLVSASHQDLQRRMQEGLFREDLFYRVSEIQLNLPPLRERPEDIPLLAQSFIDLYLKENKEKAKLQLGKELLKKFMDYPWPGNVRELQNMVRVATALRQGAVLHFKDLPDTLQHKLVNISSVPETPPSARFPRPPASLGWKSAHPKKLFDPQLSWREMELVVLAKSLEHFDFDVGAAAKALGCAPSKLYQRIREYGLEGKRGEWAAHPFVYSLKKSLEEVKREIFQEALDYCQGSAYQVARMLKVSPGMVYQWMER